MRVPGRLWARVAYSLGGVVERSRVGVLQGLHPVS